MYFFYSLVFNISYFQIFVIIFFISVYQTVPSELSAHLDKCLREALTIDGVLEFHNEKFWVLGLRRANTPGQSSRCVLVGSLHVRVRRDANEQLVLRLVQQKLNPLVDLLTVQVRTTPHFLGKKFYHKV